MKNNLPESMITAIKKVKQVGLIGPCFSLERTFPPHNIPLIWVDGGFDYKSEFQLSPEQPNLSIGDGDSSSQSLDINLPSQKDYSDLSFVLERLPYQNLQEIFLMGFVGGRLDHQLVVLGEVFSVVMNNSYRGTVRFGENICLYSPGEHQLNYFGTFSLLSFNPIKLKIKGEVDYPLKEEILVPPLSSKTLSNIARGDIEIKCDQYFFLIKQDCGKTD